MAKKIECSDMDPSVYISHTYFDTDFMKFRKNTLQRFHQFFTGSKSDLKILEVGAGPVIVHAISAAQYASEIVLSDYSDNFRSALQKWVDGDPTAHEWSGYFKYVVEDLEGKTEKEAKERETQLRNAIKAIVPCDITKDPPLPPEYMGHYDVVMTVLCLEAACHTRDAYKAAIGRMYKLLKPGGRMAIYGAEKDMAAKRQEGAYIVLGNQGYAMLYITADFVEHTLRDAGFSDIQMQSANRTDMNIIGDQPRAKMHFFFSALKK